MKLICPDCGTQYDFGKFCQECGAKLQEVTPELVCPSCGYKAKSGKFCPECGTKLTEQIPVSQAPAVPETQQRTFNERDYRFAKYYDKKGFPRTISQEERALAKEELTPYVNQNIAEAKMLLGLILLDEFKECNEQNVFERSESLLKEAENAGDKFAYYMLGLFYFLKGETEKLDEAEKRLLECYEEYQDGDSAGILAELYAYTEAKLDYKKAFEYATIAADEDETSGYQVLGALYLNGWGVEKDIEKAEENYIQAAALGDELSMNQIGYIYLGQEGGEANPDKAFYWFNEASKKGDDMGMYNLGCCYREGFGVEADYETAAEWFKKSADLGNVSAMKDLGQYYQEVLIDGKKALMWYTKAAEAGDAESKSLLSELYDDEENCAANKESIEQASLVDRESTIKEEKSNGGTSNEWIVPEGVSIFTDLTFKSLPNTSAEWRGHIETIRLPKTFRVEDLAYLDDTYDYMDNSFYAFLNLRKVIIPTGEIDRFCKLSTWINQNWDKIWNDDGTHVYPAILPLMENNEYFSFTPYTETVVSKNYFGNVILSPKCKEISPKTFRRNKGLDTIYMFDSVEIIGKEAFLGCENLKEIHWSKNAKAIQKNVLNGCKSLKKIVIPEGVTAIEEAAFYDCKSLESISLPSTIVSIAKGGTFGFNPFQLCGSLKEIVVPEGTKAKFQQLLNGFSGNPANLLVERNI